MFVPGFAALSLFPMMSRLYVNSQKDLATLYTKLINLIILIGLPTSAGLWLIAPKLIYLIFEEDFAELRLAAIASFPEKLHGNVANLLRSPSREHQEPMDSRLRECRRKCDFNS